MLVRRLLRRCLERDRSRRLHDIADARLEIDEALSTPAEATTGISTHSHSRIGSALPWSLAAVVSIACAVIKFWRGAPPEPPNFQVLLQPPEKAVITPVQANMGGIAVSPDGRTLAFVATHEGRTLLWVRRLDSLDARSLPKTDNAYFPFWSPDSRFLAFFAEGKLKKIDLTGGAPRVIAQSIGLGRGGTWNREGMIVFSGGRALQRVAVSGGTPVRLTEFGSLYWPSFLPDGRHFLFPARNALGKSAIRVGSLDGQPGASQGIELLSADSNGVYAPFLDLGIASRHAGWLFTLRFNTLFAQTFNTDRLKLEGEAVPVAERVGYVASVRFANMSVSQNGVLVYGREAS